MTLGIQITQSDNAALLNSFWLLDQENEQARCLCVKDNAYAEDQVISLAELGDIQYKEVAIEAPAAQEGGQHL